jgi:hypothetical protein
MTPHDFVGHLPPSFAIEIGTELLAATLLTGAALVAVLYLLEANRPRR